ncbi:hypothetical protein AMTR_s00052p00216520 [Amborella trichopoda]|uniref:Uncharacterized protein n=1 Tax=Amborella trichopoda TaxID=13333 RepID=U5D7W7_AMBTC|nr:hypothetical protein AMTR_s00052p00216520 [Amborella trichopoda]
MTAQDGRNGSRQLRSKETCGGKRNEIGGGKETITGRGGARKEESEMAEMRTTEWRRWTLQLVEVVDKEREGGVDGRKCS